MMEAAIPREENLTGGNLNKGLIPDSNLKIVVIMGATGSGKSKLAVDLASHFPIGIISADSMQVYQWLDVLTNKAPEHEQKGYIGSHLASESPITCWVRFLLDDHAEDLEADCLMDANDNERPDTDPSEDFSYTYSRLKELDPVAAKNRIHPNDQRKIKQYLTLNSHMGVLPSKLFQGNTTMQVLSSPSFLKT